MAVLNVYSGDYEIVIGSYLFQDFCLNIPAADGKYSDGVYCYTVAGGLGQVINKTFCTNVSTTTTTTTITYDHYIADKYDCSTCTLQASSVLVAFPSGSSITLNKYYSALTPDGFSYYVTATSLSTGGLILSVSSFNTCAASCAV